MTGDFAQVTLPKLGKTVPRLGLAGNYGVSADDARWAGERGLRYWLVGASFKKVLPGIRDAIAQDRDAHVVAMLGMGAFGWQVRRSVDSMLKALGTDYLDVFKLGWLGVTSRYSPGILETLAALKAEGKVRTIGVSIHDRPRAGRLAEDSEVDVFMIRYNAKHPGAEQDIFPHLAARDPVVVSYTALAWQQLTKPVKGMGDPLTPEECYRFVLSNPHVHVTLTGPKDRAQLESNLACLDAGPLDDAEMARVREYGRQLKAKKKLDYVS